MNINLTKRLVVVITVLFLGVSINLADIYESFDVGTVSGTACLTGDTVTTTENTWTFLADSGPSSDPTMVMLIYRRRSDGAWYGQTAPDNGVDKVFARSTGVAADNRIIGGAIAVNGYSTKQSEGARLTVEMHLGKVGYWPTGGGLIFGQQDAQNYWMATVSTSEGDNVSHDGGASFPMLKFYQVIDGVANERLASARFSDEQLLTDNYDEWYDLQLDIKPDVGTTIEAGDIVVTATRHIYGGGETTLSLDLSGYSTTIANPQGGVGLAWNTSASWFDNFSATAIPIPEPCTLSLAGIGICSILFSRRKRKDCKLV